MRSILVTISIAAVIAEIPWYSGRPYPGVSTRGGVWPLPWSIHYSDFNHTIHPGKFRFVSKVGSCDVIDEAIARYHKLAFPLYDPDTYSDSPPTLTTLTIEVKAGCSTKFPQLNMDESYDLTVDESKDAAVLSANEVWGALRGLESFSQLIFQPVRNQYRIRSARIQDHPRFPHRGTLIDTGRHFLSLSVILQHLDVMSQNKMNVLHWHIVDSEAFPYTSVKFPDMSLKGAYTPAHIYSIADMKKIMNYARLRGIRVIPEFDSPGHSGSWGASISDLLPQCYNSEGKVDQLPNIMDPTIPANFKFLSEFFEEALTLFGEKFMHFGGDEVEWDMHKCWENNPDVKKRMKAMGVNTTHELLDYYWKTLFGLIDKARPGTKKIVWQEVLDMNVNVSDAIAHVWKGNSVEVVREEMANVTAAGHYAILSSCWYLDLIKYGADWKTYYQCDPTDFQGTDKQKARVLGGEAALWGEYVDGTNFITRMWPRASAVAERLWSDPAQTKSYDDAWPRLHEFRCRMMNRGFAAAPPNAPDYCPFEWDPIYKEL